MSTPRKCNWYAYFTKSGEIAVHKVVRLLSYQYWLYKSNLGKTERIESENQLSKKWLMLVNLHVEISLHVLSFLNILNGKILTIIQTMYNLWIAEMNVSFGQ